MNPRKAKYSKKTKPNQTKPPMPLGNNQTKRQLSPRGHVWHCLTGTLNQHQQNWAAVTVLLSFICRLEGQIFNFSDSQFLYAALKFFFTCP